MVYGRALGGPWKAWFDLATAAPQTVVTVGGDRGDVGLLVAPDDATTTSDPFGTLPARGDRTILVFQHDDGRTHVEHVDVLIVPGPPDASRLGMDILSRWIVVLDGPGDQLFIEPGES